MDEEWREVKGYVGKYEVSNLGAVRSLPRNGTVPNVRVLKPVFDSDGYVFYCLMADDIRKNKKAHRLVAEAFIPNPDGKPHINHIDNNRVNNRRDNLEWVTSQENSDHMCQQYRHVFGENVHSARLTPTQVREIRGSSLPRNKLAEKYAVSWNAIDSVLKGDTWRYLL